jgi:hypothetical protein
MLQSGGQVTVKREAGGANVPGLSVRKMSSDGAIQGFQPPPNSAALQKLQAAAAVQGLHLFGLGANPGVLAGQVGSRRGRKRKVTGPATPSPTLGGQKFPGKSPKRFGVSPFGDEEDLFLDGSMSAPASVDGSSPSGSDDGSGGLAKLSRNQGALHEHLKIFHGPILKNEVTVRPVSASGAIADVEREDEDEDLEEEEESLAAIAAELNRPLTTMKPPAKKPKPSPSPTFTLQRSLSSSSSSSGNADATSSMLLHLSEKTALSITPVSSSSNVGHVPSSSGGTTATSSASSVDSGNPLARFGLERRPGIEIIPISSSSAVAAASSAQQQEASSDAAKEEKKVKLRDVRKESIGTGSGGVFVMPALDLAHV